MPFADLAAQAGAGPVVVKYLTMRSMNHVATLALVADNVENLQKYVVQPLVDGFQEGTTKIQVPPNVARAVITSMWSEARRQWEQSLNPLAPPTPSGTTTAGTAPPPRGDPDAKAPRTFPQWAQRVDQYNAILLDGQRRRFPEMVLLGAEHILARIYHEHHTTRLYTPVTSARSSRYAPSRQVEG